eukprot:IDg15286t1
MRLVHLFLLCEAYIVLSTASCLNVSRHNSHLSVSSRPQISDVLRFVSAARHATGGCLCNDAALKREKMIAEQREQLKRERERLEQVLNRYRRMKDQEKRQPLPDIAQSIIVPKLPDRPAPNLLDIRKQPVMSHSLSKNPMLRKPFPNDKALAPLDTKGPPIDFYNFEELKQDIKKGDDGKLSPEERKRILGEIRPKVPFPRQQPAKVSISASPSNLASMSGTPFPLPANVIGAGAYPTAVPIPKPKNYPQELLVPNQANYLPALPIPSQSALPQAIPIPTQKIYQNGVSEPKKGSYASALQNVLIDIPPPPSTQQGLKASPSTTPSPKGIEAWGAPYSIPLPANEEKRGSSIVLDVSPPPFPSNIARKTLAAKTNDVKNANAKAPNVVINLSPKPTSTPSTTSTASNTLSPTPSSTSSRQLTPTPSSTSSYTPTPSPSNTPSYSPTPTLSTTPSRTSTPTPSSTPSYSPSPMPSRTSSYSPAHAISTSPS